MGRPGRRARASSRSDVLAPGTLIQLEGLTNGQLNGSIGRVEDYDEAAQRYVIAPDSGGSPIAIKPANVVQLVTAARVVGTSKAELNDKAISTATYCKSTKRYKCQGLRPDGSVLALKPENVVLPESSRVTIENVKSRPELNGKVGMITGIENGRSRYLVELDGEALSLGFGAVAAA